MNEGADSAYLDDLRSHVLRLLYCTPEANQFGAEWWVVGRFVYACSFAHDALERADVPSPRRNFGDRILLSTTE